MSFAKKSAFDLDSDSVRAEMDRMFDVDKVTKSDSDSALYKQIRSWSDELHDVIFEIEENVVADGDEYDRLRDVHRSMEDLLDSIRDESRSANSPHRSSSLR